MTTPGQSPHRSPRIIKRSGTLAAHTLLSLARQREGLDPDRCRLVIEHLDTHAHLRGAIQRALAPLQLNELQFGVLLVLFSLEPDSVAAADLAIHVGVSRPAMVETLERLGTQQLVERTRAALDRRVVLVRLTDAGRALIEPAALRVLHALHTLTRFIDAGTRDALLNGYALLQEGAATFET